jgi:hypothetical protein
MGIAHVRCGAAIDRFSSAQDRKRCKPSRLGSARLAGIRRDAGRGVYAPLYTSLQRTGLVLLGALALAFAAGMSSPGAWWVPIQTLPDGVLVDLRDMPRNLQEIAFAKGIPYIPADRK